MSQGEICPACGLANCRSVYAGLLAAQYADPERWPLQGLTVSAYAAQHPGEPSLRAARTVGTHLVVLASVAERGLDPDRVTRVRSAAEERLTEGMTWLEPPPAGAGSTVAAPAGAPDAETHRQRVVEWAGEVWASWADHHDTVRRWVDWLVAASPPDFAAALPRSPIPSRRSHGQP